MFLEGLKNKDGEVKRGPGRPRRYPSAQEEGGSETKPIELNIVSYQAEASEPQKEKKKVQLGEVLELAVKSMSVTMAEDDVDKETEVQEPEKSSNHVAESESHKVYEITEDQDSDFEWKLDNEEENSSHSPPIKRKKTGNANVVVPTVSVPDNSRLKSFDYSFAFQN